MNLRSFQREFLSHAIDPNIQTAAMSLPRGNGKSWLAGYLAHRIMTPADLLFRPGTESVIVAASLEQGRIVYRFARDMLADDTDYRFSDSLTRVQIIHKPTRTVLQVRSSNAKSAMGLVNTPYVILDEPGAWEVNAGTLMFDAIQTAQGKPGSPLTAIYIGTIAPARDGWWPQMIKRGSHGTTYVKVLQGDAATWDSWHTIRKANPLVNVDAGFRRKLLEERDEARADSRLKARFLSYRLNIPTADESEMLLTVDDWKLATAREQGERDGQPIVGIDLGGGRAWSAAVAVWPSGLVDGIALAPGIPDLADQEKRDRAAMGIYRELHGRGVLRVAEGLQVQPPRQLWDFVLERWGMPFGIVCDRFRLGELVDATQGRVPIEPRVTRWSDAASDIRALRRMVRNGPLSVTLESRLLFAASLADSTVKNDDQGNTRLTKRSTDNAARDDVAAALLLGAGAWDRYYREREVEAVEEELFVAR